MIVQQQYKQYNIDSFEYKCNSYETIELYQYNQYNSQ